MNYRQHQAPLNKRLGKSRYAPEMATRRVSEAPLVTRRVSEEAVKILADAF